MAEETKQEVKHTPRSALKEALLWTVNDLRAFDDITPTREMLEARRDVLKQALRNDIAPALAEALKNILADHDERRTMYPEMETQPNKVKVMHEGRHVLARYSARRDSDGMQQ